MADSRSSVDRRRFLQAALAAAGSTALPAAWRSASASSLAATTVPLRSNLHTHASFSEEAGAYDGHLHQAKVNGFDAVVFSEHDTMMFSNAVPTFTFESSAVPYRGGNRQLVAESAGSAGAGSAVTIAQDAALGRPVLSAVLSGAGPPVSRLGVALDESDAGKPSHHSILAQTPTLDVRIDQCTGGGVLFARFDLSDHPAYGARPAARYVLEYRFSTTAGPAERVVVGAREVLGVVTLRVTAGRWASHRFDLLADAARLFGTGGGSSPEPGDNTLDLAHFGAHAPAGSSVSGAIKDFAVERPALDLVALQSRLIARYASGAPGLVVAQGMEISWGHHVGQVGGEAFLGRAGFEYAAAVQGVHDHGGVAAINHPFGTSEHSLLPAASQDALLRLAVNRFLPSQFYAADLLEIYPNQRGGCDMQHHLDLWDTASRNGIVLTAVSSNDDHGGTDWLHEPNPGYTTAHATARTVGALAAALAAGRAFIGVLGRFDGSLDLALGNAPMGSVVSTADAHPDLVVTATGTPAGGAVQVVQGSVDNAGTQDPTPGTRVIHTAAGRRFGDSAAPVRLPVAVGRNTFTRVQVVDARGEIVAVSQPVWRVDRGRTMAPGPRRRTP